MKSKSVKTLVGYYSITRHGIVIRVVGNSGRVSPACAINATQRILTLTCTPTTRHNGDGARDAHSASLLTENAHSLLNTEMLLLKPQFSLIPAHMLLHSVYFGIHRTILITYMPKSYVGFQTRHKTSLVFSIRNYYCCHNPR